MSEWQVRPLGELADLVMGQSPESAFVHETERGLPFLQGCAEFGPRHPSPVYFVDPPQRVAPGGSVLISVRAPVGTLNMADRDYGIGRGLAAVIGRRRSSRYLAFAIERSIEWLHARSQGSTFLAIGSADLRSLPVPVRVSPHADELAAEQLNGVDTQITHTDALIAKQEQVRAGLMQDLFTRGVDETGRLRPPREEAPELYHETALGWLPKGWEARKLVELTTKITDGVHHTPDYVEQGVPFVTVRNLTAGRSINFSDLSFISERDHAIFKLRADPRVGDVLVSKDGTLGIARRVDDIFQKFSIFVSVALLRPIAQQIAPMFLEQFFSSNSFHFQLGSLSAGSGLKHIHLEHFRKFLVPLPSIQEQEKLLGTLQFCERDIISAEKHLQKLRQLRSSLLRDLLTPPAAAAEPRIAAE